MPRDIVDEVRAGGGVEQREFTTLESVMATSDVLYVTRVQKERFADIEDYHKVAKCFIITPELLTRLGAKPSLRILHPLPRVGELSHGAPHTTATPPAQSIS